MANGPFDDEDGEGGEDDTETLTNPQLVDAGKQEFGALRRRTRHPPKDEVEDYDEDFPGEVPWPD